MNFILTIRNAIQLENVQFVSPKYQSMLEKMKMKSGLRIVVALTQIIQYVLANKNALNVHVKTIYAVLTMTMMKILVALEV